MLSVSSPVKWRPLNLSNSPPAERKSGIPLSVLIPAPVKATMRFDLRIISAKRSLSFMLGLLSDVVLSVFIIAFGMADRVLFRIQSWADVRHIGELSGVLRFSVFDQSTSAPCLGCSAFILSASADIPFRRTMTSSYWPIYYYKPILVNPNNVFIHFQNTTLRLFPLIYLANRINIYGMRNKPTAQHLVFSP